MKEFKIEDITPVKGGEKQITKIFDLLRTEPIDSSEYHVVLFLLSLYKDGVISKEILCDHDDVHENIFTRIHKVDKAIAKLYGAIYNGFESTVKRISSKGLNAVIQEISEIEKKVLSNDFPSIFDEILYRITQSQGRHGGEFIQPLELTRLMCTMVELSKKSKIFNPFAGLASFGVYLDQGHDYLGQEINHETCALGALRLMAYERSDTSQYTCEDSILNWPDQSEKFDLILANPPFGLRLSQEQREVCPDGNSIEQFLIEKSINSLNEKGKLIALLPQSFLFKSSSKRFRERLIENDLIDTIISLPGGLLLNTGIPLVVLVIGKDKKKPGKVRFIDAKDFVEIKNSRERILNDASLNRLVHDIDQDSDAVRIVENVQIIEFNYNLHAPRYFQKHIEGTKLRDILDEFRGKKDKLSKGGKFIRIRDLKDDRVDFKLDLSEVGEMELSSRPLRQINETCLLLASCWVKLKPTLFDYSETPILLNSDIMPFKVNEKHVDLAYLISELHAEYVQDQLDSFRLGGTIPRIRKEDLLEVVIKLPSLKEQRAKVEGVLEFSDSIKVWINEKNAIAHGQEASQFNEFASLKHTLGRPRQNILDWTDNLLHFLSVKREGFDTLNKTFHELYEKDILSALKEIKHDVNFMTNVLEKGEHGLIVNDYPITILSLLEINSLVMELSENGFNFKIVNHFLPEEDLLERGVQGNIVLLKILLQNILTNAHKYGYDEMSDGNEVVFDLKEIDGFLSMEVRNNGKSFPKNFDRDKFITKYSTADSQLGTGLGGYDIHRIASYFNNPDWILSLNNDPIYPVKFNFQFPIKLIN